MKCVISSLYFCTAVRYGRVPKRSLSSQDVVTSSSGQLAGSEETSNQSEAGLQQSYDTILIISQAHHAHCDVTEDKIKALTPRPVSLVSDARFLHCRFGNKEYL